MRTQRNVTVVPYTTLYRSAGDREREVLRRRHDGRAGGAARRRAIPRHHLERLRPLRLRAQGWFDVRRVPPAAEGDAHPDGPDHPRDLAGSGVATHRSRWTAPRTAAGHVHPAAGRTPARARDEISPPVAGTVRG